MSNKKIISASIPTPVDGRQSGRQPVAHRSSRSSASVAPIEEKIYTKREYEAAKAVRVETRHPLKPIKFFEINFNFYPPPQLPDTGIDPKSENQDKYVVPMSCWDRFSSCCISDHWAVRQRHNNWTDEKKMYRLSQLQQRRGLTPAQIFSILQYEFPEQGLVLKSAIKYARIRAWNANVRLFRTVQKALKRKDYGAILTAVFNYDRARALKMVHREVYRQRQPLPAAEHRRAIACFSAAIGYANKYEDLPGWKFSVAERLLEEELRHLWDFKIFSVSLDCPENIKFGRINFAINKHYFRVTEEVSSSGVIYYSPHGKFNNSYKKGTELDVASLNLGSEFREQILEWGSNRQHVILRTILNILKRMTSIPEHEKTDNIEDYSLYRLIFGKQQLSGSMNEKQLESLRAQAEEFGKGFDYVSLNNIQKKITQLQAEVALKLGDLNAKKRNVSQAERYYREAVLKGENKAVDAFFKLNNYVQNLNTMGERAKSVGELTEFLKRLRQHYVFLQFRDNTDIKLILDDKKFLNQPASFLKEFFLFIKSYTHNSRLESNPYVFPKTVAKVLKHVQNKVISGEGRMFATDAFKCVHYFLDNQNGHYTYADIADLMIGYYKQSLENLNNYSFFDLFLRVELYPELAKKGFKSVLINTFKQIKSANRYMDLKLLHRMMDRSKGLHEFNTHAFYAKMKALNHPKVNELLNSLEFYSTPFNVDEFMARVKAKKKVPFDNRAINELIKAAYACTKPKKLKPYLKCLRAIVTMPEYLRQSAQLKLDRKLFDLALNKYSMMTFDLKSEFVECFYVLYTVPNADALFDKKKVFIPIKSIFDSVRECFDLEKEIVGSLRSRGLDGF